MCGEQLCAVTHRRARWDREIVLHQGGYHAPRCNPVRWIVANQSRQIGDAVRGFASRKEVIGVFYFEPFDCAGKLSICDSQLCAGCIDGDSLLVLRLAGLLDAPVCSREYNKSAEHEYSHGARQERAGWFTSTPENQPFDEASRTRLNGLVTKKPIKLIAQLVSGCEASTWGLCQAFKADGFQISR